MSKSLPQPDAQALALQLGLALDHSAAYRRLAPAAQRELRNSLRKLDQALDLAGDGPLGRQLAPDLQSRLSPGGGAPSGAPAGGSAAPSQGGQPAAGNPAGGAPAAGGPMGRVGEVARATLNAVDFPSFVASLIQGTFQAIVDASIQQMEAYAELIRNVAGTVDQFMQENISEGNAKDFLADKYTDVFYRDSSTGVPRLGTREATGSTDGLPSFFKDLGFDHPAELTPQAVDEVVVPAARRHLAEIRQQTLSTMVLMGLNRIVVDQGEINAKLVFHVDASETMEMKFNQAKTTSGNLAGQAGRNPFTANAIMVNTANVNAQNDINLRADLTGEVRVKFRSDVIPLERFADSAAIQLINSHARVPEPARKGAEADAGAAAPAQDSGSGAAAQSLSSERPPAAARGTVASPAAAGNPADRSRSRDPWAPSRRTA